MATEVSALTHSPSDSEMHQCYFGEEIQHCAKNRVPTFGDVWASTGPELSVEFCPDLIVSMILPI